MSHSPRNPEGLKINATSLNIEAGAQINLSELGLKGGKNGSVFNLQGETFATDGFTIIAGAEVGQSFSAGASYGGLGAPGLIDGNPNPIYGNQYYPDFLGSGGTSNNVMGGPAGNGGGKLFLYSQNLIVNGDIWVNGGHGASHAGGGSGGSILIYSSSIEGAGTIKTEGGNGGCGADPNQCSGSGGGGRIAIFATQKLFPEGNISAGPGTNPSNPAKAGTIVYDDCNFVNNVGIDTILMPTAGAIMAGTAIIPKVVVQNFAPISNIFPIEMRIGNSYLDESYLNLESGEKDTLDFTSWTVAQAGSYFAIAQTKKEGG